MVEKVPDSTYEMVGGLDKQIREIKEVIELPVKHPELFEALGIDQPKGVLLYGPPGTGKTLLARAVAHHTKCTFIRVSGSELVQKYIGEGKLPAFCSDNRDLSVPQVRAWFASSSSWLGRLSSVCTIATESYLFPLGSTRHPSSSWMRSTASAHRAWKAEAAAATLKSSAPC